MSKNIQEVQNFTFGPRPERESKHAMWVASLVAWFGVIVTNIGNVTDIYPRESGGWPGLYGKSVHGWAGAPQRFIEGISYFTMISNIMVAVVFMMIALSPRKTKWRSAMLDTTMMMITVTSIVFLTAILPFLHLSGLALLTSPWQHVVTPLTAWIVWALWGPRDFFNGAQGLGEVCLCLLRTAIIPAAWSVWMLIYGAFTHLYPYGFVNVNSIGYRGVAVSLVVVLLFGFALELVFWAIDNQIMKRMR
ncbi:Pr6Pr family membrane protein [Alloscardovia venturai]|uniref:Pr6Pr family membrane protein n=1 Tax=Alloscardovia venturai TaxID=1769421 RepID=A0ABW2Y997_9BIFI